MAACWDCFSLEPRPDCMVKHTHRKLNNLTRHLKMVIRAMMGCKQHIIKPNDTQDRSTDPLNHRTDPQDTALPYHLTISSEM